MSTEATEGLKEQSCWKGGGRGWTRASVRRKGDCCREQIEMLFYSKREQRKRVWPERYMCQEKVFDFCLFIYF